jgi:uncharacterized membrane protein
VLYNFFKFIHLLGVVVLLGNVIATGLWKALADATRSAQTVAFAQRLVILSDWVFTGSGIALILSGGYAMVMRAHLSLLHTSWLLWGQGLFLFSALIWALVLLPLQSAQGHMARRFAADGLIPPGYWRLARHWLGWGILATVPLVLSLGIMVLKP